MERASAREAPLPAVMPLMSICSLMKKYSPRRYIPLFPFAHYIRSSFALQRIKRKAPVQDSDDSDSALPKVAGRTKKRRISRPPSEEPEENEDVSIGGKAFTQKLQKFKKSPRKKAQCMRFPHPPPFMITADNLPRQETQADE